MADHDKKDTKDVDNLFEEMKRKNEEFRKRHEIVQEDKRHAEETGSSITNVHVPKSVAEERISLHKGQKSSSGVWEDRNSDSDAEGNTHGSPTNFRSHERAWDRGKVSKDGRVLGILERGEPDNRSSRKRNLRSFRQRESEKAPPNQRPIDFTRKTRGNVHGNQYKKSEFLKPAKGEFAADGPFNYAPQSAEQRNLSRSERGKRMTSWDYNNHRQYSGGRGGYADGGDRQNVNPKRPFSKQSGSRQQRDPYNKRTQWDDAGIKQNMDWNKKHDRFDNHVQYSQKDVNRPGFGVSHRKNNSEQNRYVSKERTFLADGQQKEWEEPRKNEHSGTWSDDDDNENSNCNKAEKTFSGLCQQPVHSFAKNFESSGQNWEPYSMTSDQNDLDGTWSHISDTGDSNCDKSEQTHAFSSNAVENLSQGSSKIKDVMEASSSPHVEEERLEASSSETSKNAENKCDNLCDDIYNDASNIEDLNTSNQVAGDGDFGDENVKCLDEITALDSNSPERSDHLVSDVDSEICEIFNAHQPEVGAACGESVKSDDGSSEIICESPADKLYSDAMDGSCSTLQEDYNSLDGNAMDGGCSILQENSDTMDGDQGISQQAVSYGQISEQKTEVSNASVNRHRSSVESDMNKFTDSDDAQKLVKRNISGKEGFGVYRSGEQPNGSSGDRITEDMQHVLSNQEHDASVFHSEQKNAPLAFGKDDTNCDTACGEPAVEKKMFSSGKDSVSSCTSELGSVLHDSASVACLDHDTKTDGVHSSGKHTGTTEEMKSLCDRSPYDHSDSEYEELKFFRNRKL